MSYQILLGDNRQILPTLADNSVDSIVTDPPYELGFMGKSWDSTGIAYDVELWRECLRVLKPGGHLLAFGGSRTYHRLACAVEDAGFEIRDQIMWVYGSGFPKSLNIAKALDKQAGVPIKVGKAFKVAGEYGGRDLRDPELQGADRDAMRHQAVTDEAKRWVGWGTALKPAHEPIVVARKPLSGTVAANVLEWGVGGLNIDGCRVGTEGGTYNSREALPSVNGIYGDGLNGGKVLELNKGRWPANLIHDGSDEVLELFPETSAGARPAKANKPTGEHYEGGWGPISDGERVEFAGGSAARFFYCAKTGKKERNAGLDHLPTKQTAPEYRPNDNGQNDLSSRRHGANTPRQNHHPTVKPIALMRYLVRLVTPPNGTILDPFTGSGTTGIAAILENNQFIGIEMTDEYAEIAQARIQHWEQTR